MTQSRIPARDVVVGDVIRYGANSYKVEMVDHFTAAPLSRNSSLPACVLFRWMHPFPGSMSFTPNEKVTVVRKEGQS